MRLITSLFCCGIFLFPLPSVSVAEPDKGKWGDPFAIADKLLERVTLKDQDNITFKDALALLSDKYDLNFQIDSNAKWNNGALASHINRDRKYVSFLINEPIEQTNVQIRGMKNVRLETVLRSLCEQVQGMYLIKSDHIRIASLATVNLEVRQKSLQPSEGEEEDSQHWSTLVHAKWNNKTLQEALDEISTRTDVTILLAPQVGENAKTPITAKFLNTPIDNAVSLLAEMADLKMVRKGNAYLVTTPERADSLTTKKMQELEMGNFGGIGCLTGSNLEGALLKLLAENQSTNEMKKQITDLQQKVAEFEKKDSKANEKK